MRVYNPFATVVLLLIRNDVATMGSRSSLLMFATLRLGRETSLAERQFDETDDDDYNDVDYTWVGMPDFHVKKTRKALSKPWSAVWKKLKPNKLALRVISSMLSGIRTASSRVYEHRYDIKVAKISANIVLFSLAVVGTGGVSLIAAGGAVAVIFAAIEAKKMLQSSTQAESVGAFTFNVVKAGVLTTASSLGDPGILELFAELGAAAFDWICGFTNDVVDMSGQYAANKAKQKSDAYVFFEVNETMLEEDEEAAFKAALKDGLIEQPFGKKDIESAKKALKVSGASFAQETFNYFTCAIPRIIPQSIEDKVGGKEYEYEGDSSVLDIGDIVIDFVDEDEARKPLPTKTTPKAKKAKPKPASKSRRLSFKKTKGKAKKPKKNAEEFSQIHGLR